MRGLAGAGLCVWIGLAAAGAARAQGAYYTGYYGFGDSLTDNGRVPRETGYSPSGTAGALGFGPGLYDGGRWSNAPGFFELIPARIGIPYKPGDDYAVGGAISGRQGPDAVLSPTFPFGLLDQVDQFAARDGRLGPRDLVNIWIGYNDVTPAIGGTPQQQAGAVGAVAANTVAAITRLSTLGGREFVVFNQKTDRPNVVTGTQPPGGNDIARAINAALPVALTPLSAAGLNIHYFDVDALITRLRADPTAYGFGPDANTPCSNVPACRIGGTANGGAIENQYILPEGIHDTGRTNQYIAAFLANQLNAPLTIGPQAELGQAAGLAFSATLIDFLSAERRRNLALSVPAAYSADLPGRHPPPVAVPVQPGSPLSVFALGTYVGLDRTAQNRIGLGSLGNTYGADFGGVTAGVLYQATPNLVLGAAFNYLTTSVDLRGASNGRVDMDSFQGAAFASLSFPNVFADAAVTYGANSYTLDRPGVLNDRLTAAPGGDTVTVAARVGYLFDFDGPFSAFKAGPVGEVAYARVGVDPYRERGDPLLTIGTGRQTLEGLTAGGGVQVRAVTPVFGGIATPFLNVTAQHDFLDGVRTVTSFQTYAPSLVIRTQTGRRGEDVYGRVSGGVDFDLGNGLSGVITGSSSFARVGGDDHTVSAGLRYRF